VISAGETVSVAPGRLLRALGLAAPVFVVAAVLAILVSSQLSIYHGNPLGFVNFGRHLARYTHPPVGAPIDSAYGYDGQIYWLQARDPLLLHHSTVTSLQSAEPGYHLQRPAYPALAFLLAAGQGSALPWSMLAINLLAILIITGVFSVYARRRGFSPSWALSVGLMPGLLMPMLRDLSDVMATVAMLGGLLAWGAGRRWLTGGLLAVAVLAREPMMLAVVAIGVDAAAAYARSAFKPGAVRMAISRAWPALAIPVLAFAGWQAYIRLHVGSTAGAAGPPVSPLAGFIGALRQTWTVAGGATAVWNTVYLALVVIAALAAIRLAYQRLEATSVAAVLFAATLAVITFGDQWGTTRYTAPLFGTLVIVGLQRRSRSSLGICAAAAAMTVLLPWVVGPI
jgi:hypothetical protein